MGNVLVSLDDELEAFLRRFAREKYGARKGSISRSVADALASLQESARREEARKRLMEDMERGVYLGLKGKAYEKRDDIYDD